MQITSLLASTIILCLCSAAAARLRLGAGSSLASSAGSETIEAAYEAFRAMHGRSGSQDSDDYIRRLKLFSERRSFVQQQNSRPGASWQAEINQFADYTRDEFHALLGHLRMDRTGTGSSDTDANFLQVKSEKSTLVQAPAWREMADHMLDRMGLLRPASHHASSLHGLATSVDYRFSLNSSSFVKNQGACGSCWAVAAVGALEMHAELAVKQMPQELSFMQLVDCVENPKHCGGSGGCDGANAELAFDYVTKNGISLAHTYGGNVDRAERCSARSGQTYLRTEGFAHLQPNNLRSLMEAVAHRGPVVVGVDATLWDPYAGGVFDACGRDATINHAVVVTGYGQDPVLGRDYWLVRNSWGTSWGEDGYMRLQRHASDRGRAGHCGIDRKPQEGVWCAGGATEVPVCGMCGILSDASYPQQVTFAT